MQVIVKKTSLAEKFRLLAMRSKRIFTMRHIWALVFFMAGNQSLAEDCLSCNFDGQNLGFADFSNSDLSGSSFRNAYLVGADFTNAVLDGSDFSDAIANSAVFKNAHLENTIFLETELELADFEGAHIIGANFTKAYLVHSRLDAQNSDGAVFCATIMFDATENNRDC